MKAKEYLQQLKRLDELINQKIKEVTDLRERAISVSGIDYSKDKVQTSSSGDAPYANIVTRIIDLSAEVDAEINKFVDEKHKIINQIQQLQNVEEMTILHKRYIEYLSFERIAVDMNYTIRNIYFIHGRALQSFEKMFL